MANIGRARKLAMATVFLAGLEQERVASVLSRYGFTEAELEKGWRLLRAAAEAPPPVVVARSAQQLLRDELEQYARTWFPLVRVLLRRRFPDVGKAIFQGLGGRTRHVAWFRVLYFLSWFDALARGETRFGTGGIAVVQCLAASGFGAQERAAGHALLERVVVPDAPSNPSGADAAAARHEAQQAYDALWRWYLDWSGVARHVIRDLAARKALGLGKLPGRPRKGAQKTPDTRTHPHRA